MARLEASHWTASASEDLTRPRSWTLRNRTRNFPDVLLGAVGAIVAAPSVRASAIDVAPELVVGLLCERGMWTAFCFEAASYAEVGLWLASAPAAALARHDLLAIWSSAVATQRVEAFRWTDAVDSAAVGAPSRATAASARVRLGPGERLVALRDPDRERRRRLGCEMLAQLGPSPHSGGLAFVDNLTVVGGDGYQVAGLVPGHRFAGPGWRVIEKSGRARCDMALARFRNRLDAAVRAAAAAKAGRPFPQARTSVMNDDETRSATRSRLWSACDVIAAALARNHYSWGEAGAAANDANPLIEEARAAAAAAGLPPQAFDAFAGALSFAREPAATAEAVAGWLRAADALDLPLRAFAVALVAQPLYDRGRSRPGPSAAGESSFGLDDLLDRLLGEVERLVEDGLNSPGGGLITWPQRARATLIDGFDALAELETTSPARDLRLAHARATVRLQCGRPTADVVLHSVRAGLVGVDGLLRLIEPGRWSHAHRELGALAAADALDLPLAQGAAALREAAGKEAAPGEDSNLSADGPAFASLRTR